MYTIEVKPASHNGWFTPAESNAYYKLRYARQVITIHWWGDGTDASNHDNIVNYMNGQAYQGNKSTNYVLSDAKITECVSPDNVAWCTGPTANAISISIELQPTLGAEGYKKAGWLVAQLEARFGHTLDLKGHREFMQTACPGTIDISRIRAEANAWKAGAYNAPAPQPAPSQPKPQGAEMINTADEAVKAYKLLRPNYSPNQDEINATAGKRSWLQFVNDGQREREQRDAALLSQQQALAQAQVEAQNLRTTITEIQKLEELEDITEAQKDQQLADLGGKLQTTTNDLQKALLEVERLNNVVCQVPETKTPDTFTLLEKILTWFMPKPKS